VGMAGGGPATRGDKDQGAAVERAVPGRD